MGPKSSLPEEFTSLPQYGFGDKHTFKELVKQNPFLFRVYTPKQRSSFVDDSDPFFLGLSFNEKFTVFPEKLSDPASSVYDVATTGTYADVVRHMGWTTRASSPYISTSFSFVWALWEAVRRYRVNMKHDIEIAVIDAHSLAGRAVTAAELLRKGKAEERHPNHSKWYRFALDSQDVLVFESIPGAALYASLPLLYIIERLPSYFLQHHSPHLNATPFDRLVWQPSAQKPSYRMFCQEMSEIFLSMPAELRLRDTTVGSVRLAMSLLRPWFRDVMFQDKALVTSTLCKLSYVLAQWPGKWWTRDHTEMWDIIRATTQMLVEEMEEHDRVLLEEARLRGVAIDQEPIRHFHGHSSCIECAFPRARTSSFSGASATDVDDSRSIHTLVEEGDSLDKPEKRIVKVVEQLAINKQQKSFADWSAEVGEHARSSSPFPPPEIDTLSESSTESTPSEIEVSEDDVAQEHSKTDPVLPNYIRPHSLAETASCVVTGLLFGAFIVLCIMSSQRRVLAMHVY